MATARRFVFTERLKSGEERAMLANLDALFVPGRRTARIIAELDRVPGNPPVEGIAIDSYDGLYVSPDNAYVAVTSYQVGPDFIDFNTDVFDMETGANVTFFNEHSVADVNRANCPLPAFDALLEAEAAAGVPQDALDTYNYWVNVDGSDHRFLNLAWSVNGTLLATFEFDVFATTATYGLTRAQFTFEIGFAPVPGGREIRSRNAGIAPYSPMPSNNFDKRRLATALSPDAPYMIHYRKQPVAFHPWPAKRLPAWLGGLLMRPAYRSAMDVEGFVREGTR